MKKILALLFLGGASLFARTHVSIAIGSGGYYPGYYAPPPPPPVVRYVQPPCPGPGYGWVPGYWVPSGARWSWRAGYWAPRPHSRAVWVAPHYVRGRYYRGYWR
jgi:hypothetical protein